LSPFSAGLSTVASTRSMALLTCSVAVAAQAPWAEATRTRAASASPSARRALIRPLPRHAEPSAGCQAYEEDVSRGPFTPAAHRRQAAQRECREPNERRTSVASCTRPNEHISRYLRPIDSQGAKDDRE